MKELERKLAELKARKEVLWVEQLDIRNELSPLLARDHLITTERQAISQDINDIEQALHIYNKHK